MQLIGEAFGWSHISMLPVMSRDVLGVGAQGLGYLMAASHVGFLIGNLGLSTMGDLKHKSRTAVIGYGGFGLLLALFAGSRSFPLSLALIGAAYAWSPCTRPTCTRWCRPRCRTVCEAV